jgi:hypothetical protein
MADVEIVDNIIDGYNYSFYSQYGAIRDMWMLIAHTTDLSSVPVGEDPRPQNILISGNTVTHGATWWLPGWRPLTARYTDGLEVTNNDANYSGDWLYPLGCTSVTESGNT